MQAHYHDWEPPEDLTTHSGDSIARSAEFFTEPPEEIGDVTSAYTSLSVRNKPMAMPVRLLVTLLVAIFGAGVGLLISIMAKVENPIWFVVWPLGGFLLAGLICWLVTSFSHTCTYVGRLGIAKFTCEGSRDNITGEMFLYEEATELRTHQVRRYTNGVYQGTDYTYTWTDVGGRKRHILKGTYSSEQGTPSEGDLYYYATAAEVAWSLYLLEDAHRQMTTKGEVRFRLGEKNYVSVGDGYLRLKIAGEVTECDTRDIASVSIKQGVFKVKLVDAKEGWFSSSGIFKFDYEKLANAQLFLYVLDKIAGIEIE